jgi:AcrR family transcriptional regulator
VGAVQRKQAQARREEILRATIREIEVRGIGALRIADVARPLGVSTGLIVYHFQTKEKLVAEAFLHAAERDLRKLAQLTSSGSRVTDRLLDALTWYAPTGRAEGWLLWIEGWAAGLRDPELQRVSRDLDRRWKEALVALIDEGAALGLFRPADPQAAAGRITALLDGMAVQAVVHHGTLPRSRLLDWLVRQVCWELDLDPAALTEGDGRAGAGSRRG